MKSVLLSKSVTFEITCHGSVKMKELLLLMLLEILDRLVLTIYN